MQVQVNTSNGIDNKESLEVWAADHLNGQLARFQQDITRIEVQLSDENHATRAGAADKRCTLEARLTHHTPVAVTHHGENQDVAFRGATEKLARLLEHTLGKLDRHEHRNRETIRKDLSAISE